MLSAALPSVLQPAQRGLIYAASPASAFICGTLQLAAGVNLHVFTAGRGTSTASIEDVGWELFHPMLDVASGRKKTWAEHWKLHNALVLFNPAPVN